MCSKEAIVKCEKCKGTGEETFPTYATGVLMGLGYRGTGYRQCSRCDGHGFLKIRASELLEATKP